MLPLKEAVYTTVENVPVHLSYLIQGNDVYLTGLPPIELYCGSGSAVVVICKAEGRLWSEYTFTHLQTRLISPTLCARGLPGDYRADRMEIVDENGLPVVQKLIPIALRKGGKIYLRYRGRRLPGIPPEVQHAFDQFLQ